MPISTIQCPKNTSSKEVSELVKDGIAYIPVPEYILKKLELIEATGMAYFQQAKDKKLRHPFTPTTREGFLDQTAMGCEIERYIVRTSLPKDPKWEACGAEMLEIRQYFRREIIQPLLFSVFEHLKIDPKKIQSHFETADSTLSILYYPERNTTAARRRIRSHEDASLMTVLWSQNPGLEIKVKDKWHGSLTKKGYIIINFGDGLRLMTNDNCHAITHRVQIPDNYSKLTIVSFYNQNPKTEFVNAVTDKKIADTFGMYAKSHIEKILKSPDTRKGHPPEN